jgi:NADH dehydrogenase (ubiquinone) 1 beta subcomplex subunit 8
MLSRRIATARPLRAALPIARRTAFRQQRGVVQAGPEYPSLVSGYSLLLGLLGTAR